MKALLDGGADPFLTLPDRTNALMIAAGQGYGGLRGEGIRIVVPTPEGAVEAVTLLLDRGMDVDAFNNAGNTRSARRGRARRRRRQVPRVARRLAQPEEQGRLHAARPRARSGRVAAAVAAAASFARAPRRSSAS